MRKGMVELCRGLQPERAGDVVVLLASEGIEAEAGPPGAGRMSVMVDPAMVGKAQRIVAEEYPYGVSDPVERPSPATAFEAEDAPPAWFGRGSGAVFLLVALCVVLFWALHMSGEPLTRSRLLRFGVIAWSRVEAGEHWRLVAAIFIHFDVLHLAANMGTLLLLAPPLAHQLGGWRFIAVFLAAGVAGNIASHELAPAVALKAGASGAIAGLLGALAGGTLRPGLESRFRSWQVLGALAAVYALTVGFGPGRDNVAHIGGLLAGVAAGRLIAPLREERPPGLAPESRYRPGSG